MLFHSYTYLAFLALAVGLYWLLPRQGRLWMLFVFSLVFYGFWRVDFLPLLLGSVVFNYFLGLWIGGIGLRRRKKAVLALGLAVNLGLLGLFKYAYFLADNANVLLGAADLPTIPTSFRILLPLGISFYTFQSISYLIDVYRGFLRPQGEFVLLADYIIFFPQLVAGPILRAGEVLWQLDVRPRFHWEHIGEGLRRVLAGLFLKVCLADRISGLVTRGFNSQPDAMGAFDVWTLAFLFGLQIYFDFSAYSHIAIGSARLMGIEFPENFAFPYSSPSPKVFWKRWHISLSSWIRDYLYLPLCKARVRDESRDGLEVAGNRQAIPEARAAFALFATWFLMGLWHGAAWTFVCWGLWHAVLVFGYRVLRRALPTASRAVRVLGWAITLPLVMLGWVFFRAHGVDQAFIMLGKVVRPECYLDLSRAGGPYEMLRFSLELDTYLVALVLTLAVLAAPVIKQRAMPCLQRRAPLALAGMETLVFAVMAAGIFVFMGDWLNVFVYFQF